MPFHGSASIRTIVFLPSHSTHPGGLASSNTPRRKQRTSAQPGQNQRIHSPSVTCPIFRSFRNRRRPTFRTQPPAPASVDVIDTLNLTPALRAVSKTVPDQRPSAPGELLISPTGRTRLRVCRLSHIQVISTLQKTRSTSPPRRSGYSRRAPSAHGTPAKKTDPANNAPPFRTGMNAMESPQQSEREQRPAALKVPTQ